MYDVLWTPYLVRIYGNLKSIPNSCNRSIFEKKGLGAEYLNL